MSPAPLPLDAVGYDASRDVVLQQPTGLGTQLILLFHGWGGTPAFMTPLGQRLAATFAQAWVVAVSAPHQGDEGRGFQWFSAKGVGEDNRATRVGAAMPSFLRTVAHWQSRSGVTTHGTCLVGFSQGAVMALESTQLDGAPQAGRVVALAGRFAALPSRVPPATTVHMIHGKHDEVIHYSHTIHAAEHWIAMGADVTADVVPFLGHAVNETVVDLVVERLTTTIPNRLWEEAMRAAR